MGLGQPTIVLTGRLTTGVTSFVVRKDIGLPGEGFLEAMVWVGYIAEAAGQAERSVWEWAFRETHEFWRPKFRDDLK